MQIKLAKTAGFCFGVNRAVDLVYSMLDEGKRVCTLGPLIHNPQVIADLESKGTRIIDKPSQAVFGETLVVRAHGVTAAVEEEISSMDIECCNATCPFVKKIHRLVSDKVNENTVVLVAGDAKHPEVQGIVGHCKVECIVFSDSEELEKIAEEKPYLSEKEILVVAQTTFSTKEWNLCEKKIKKLYTNANIFDTICCATQERQQEAYELSLTSDAMIIIGGRQSSNTAKLKADRKSVV